MAIGNIVLGRTKNIPSDCRIETILLSWLVLPGSLVGNHLGLASVSISSSRKGKEFFRCSWVCFDCLRKNTIWIYNFVVFHCLNGLNEFYFDRSCHCPGTSGMSRTVLRGGRSSNFPKVLPANLLCHCQWLCVLSVYRPSWSNRFLAAWNLSNFIHPFYVMS